ncbi:MAG: M20/M25/M40 family metallo-hydrolase [Candidatus Cyclobacteriaceae bacterium M3_2C_046]
MAKSTFIKLLFLVLWLVNFGSWANNDTQRKPQASAPNLNQAITLLADYLKIPSVTGNEQAAGKFLADYCQSAGLFVEHFSQEKNSYNFAASIYPLAIGKPNIIFHNHIDVVASGDTSKWDYPAFDGYVSDSVIWGRGAIDCKGLAVMQLMAILDFKQTLQDRVLPFNVTMLSVSNEETGGALGSEMVIDQYLDYLKPAVVLGEGGSGLKDVLLSKPQETVYGISIAEKSNLWLELKLKENSFGHGATPANSYANKSMIQALNRLYNSKTKLKFDRANKLMFKKLGQAEGGIKGFFLKNLNWAILAPLVKPHIKKNPLFKSLLTNTFTLTNLNNPPGPPNKISNESTAVLDCRLLPGTNPKAFIRKIKNIIDEPKIEVEIIGQGPNGGSTKPGFFYEALEKALKTYNFGENIHVIPFLFPASSDNAYFREQGIPTYGFMPAILSQEEIKSVHNENERISIKALNSGIVVFNLMLQNISQKYDQQDINLEVSSD